MPASKRVLGKGAILADARFDEPRGGTGGRARFAAPEFCEKMALDNRYHGAGHARPGRLPPERRHHPVQSAARGLLGQARSRARLAVPAGRDQAWRDPRAGNVPGAARGSWSAAGPREDPRSDARLAALRGPRAVDQARVAGELPRAEADLVPAAPRRPRLRRFAPREREARVRCLALE